MTYEEASITKPMDMRDVGTREQHCMELLDLWDSGLRILRERMRLPVVKREAQMIWELEAATGLLKKHLVGTNGGFSEMFYLREINTIKTGGIIQR